MPVDVDRAEVFLRSAGRGTVWQTAVSEGSQTALCVALRPSLLSASSLVLRTILCQYWGLLAVRRSSAPVRYQTEFATRAWE